MIKDDIVLEGDMASSLPSYYHVRLATDRTQIRLLKVLSSTTHGKDEIFTLSLDVFDLESAPAYTALSYEWGPRDDPSFVVIDDAILRIRKNLQTFMKIYATVGDLNKYFWIDQISIDQGHTDGRNAQVSHMFEIFSRAEDVIAWVGNHPLAGHLIEALSINPELVLNSVSRHRLRYDATGPSPLAQHHSSALIRFAKLTYWERTWVAQELMSTSQVRVMYGSHFLEFKEVAQLRTILVNDLVTREAYALRPLLNFWRFGRPPTPVRDNGYNYDADTWFFAMDYCKYSHCEDPRDKMYAIQNLIPHRFRVLVNYRLSVRDVFTLAAINCIWQTQPYAELSIPDARCAQGINLLAIAMSLHTKDVFKSGYDARLILRIKQLGAVLGWSTQNGPSRETEVEEERPEAFDTIARMMIDEYLAGGEESRALVDALNEPEARQ